MVADASTYLHRALTLIRESRRKQVTLVVVQGWSGDPLSTLHPTDGEFIECSYHDALVIHRTMPLRLHRVVARDRAEFRLAPPFGTFEPLSPPPYADAEPRAASFVPGQEVDYIGPRATVPQVLGRRPGVPFLVERSWHHPQSGPVLKLVGNDGIWLASGFRPRTGGGVYGGG